jgi:asparagine synthase (glutamine-hydrolysing)
MITNLDSLALGSPVFPSHELSTLARNEGLLSAWRSLIKSEGNSSIRTVSGDFSVGFIDETGRGFLAVDRFAIRSLCYRIVDGELHFAARADQLADSNSVVDSQAIFDYLYFHVIPSPRTIFKDIFRLPPGHFAVFENGSLNIFPYWFPEFDEIAKPSFLDLRTEFRQLLRNAIARQLGNGKPGCFLSGGTDSSTVAGFISEISGQRTATYSIGFEADGYDEMEYARIAARHFNTDHHEYYVTPDDLLKSIPSVAQYYDQPFGNSSALPAYYCASMARDDGVRKILAGDGGDELFGGNTRYAKQKIFGFYDSVPHVVRNALLEPILIKTVIGKLPLVRKAASYIEQSKVPLPDRTQTYNLLFRLGLNNVFDPDFLADVDVLEPMVQQRAVWSQIKSGSQTNRELAFDWRYTLAECDLPKVVGTTAMAGIEVGFPMLDSSLVDFSIRLPTSYKLKGLNLRWFFKEALRGFLPNEILAKKKQGFGLPFGVWAARNQKLRCLAEESVRGLVERNIFRQNFVDTLFSRYLYEHPGYYGEMIWIAMMLEQWFRRDVKLRGGGAGMR